jgi:hypothetical protein
MDPSPSPPFSASAAAVRAVTLLARRRWPPSAGDCRRLPRRREESPPAASSIRQSHGPRQRRRRAQRGFSTFRGLEAWSILSWHYHAAKMGVGVTETSPLLRPLAARHSLELYARSPRILASRDADAPVIIAGARIRSQPVAGPPDALMALLSRRSVRGASSGLPNVPARNSDPPMARRGTAPPCGSVARARRRCSPLRAVGGRPHTGWITTVSWLYRTSSRRTTFAYGSTTSTRGFQMPIYLLCSIRGSPQAGAASRVGPFSRRRLGRPHMPGRGIC